MEHGQERVKVHLGSGDAAASHRYVAAEFGLTPLGHQHVERNMGEVWQKFGF